VIRSILLAALVLFAAPAALVLFAAPAALVLFAAPAARAGALQGNRIFVEFAYDPSPTELRAAKKWAKEAFAKAEAAGRPIRVNVARSRGTTLMSLESVAICTRAEACPLLVFRDLTDRPILETHAFQNVLIEYREKEIYLVIRLWNKISECRITTNAKSRCHEVKKSENEFVPKDE
jgi:hypothetical protein